MTSPTNKDELSPSEVMPRMEDAIRRAQKAPRKPHAPKGKPSRAIKSKGNKVQPAKQRMQRHRGR